MSDLRSQAIRISKTQQRWLVLLAVSLLIAYGLAFGGSYGASIDEPSHARYGRQTLQIYLGQRAIDDTSVDPLQHGPFYSFVAYVAGGWVEAVRPGWLATDGRHFVYYLSFIMATVFVGVLVRRYTRPSIAWLAAGLFFSQPLLLGHAFINPKDIPFMAFFLGGLTLGVLTLPRPVPHPATPPAHAPDPRPALYPERRRRIVLASTAGSLVAAAFLGGLWFWTGLPPLLNSVLERAYAGQAAWPIQPIFNAIATDAYKTPLALYQAKLSSALATFRLGSTVILVTGAIIAWSLLAQHRIRAALAKYGEIMLASGAGMLLGLDTSIRAVAPYAAVPVVLLLLCYSKSRRKALASILVLTLTAIGACLASWPFLWQDTLGRYLQSLLTLSHFPWHGFILFDGQLLTEGQQPWYYIPELMLLQLTLPVVALAMLGLATFWRRPASTQAKVEVGVLLVTFGLPVVASFRPHTIVYNNFRQFLFTVPAFFLLAGLGLEQLFGWLKDIRWAYAAAALALIPGIVGIVHLHPYEYMYYNGLAGLGGDVYSRFESDYWCTSYRQALAWVNANAPKGAEVEIGGSGVIGQAYEFTRPDLRLIQLGPTEARQSSALVVICDGKGGQRALLPGIRTVMSVDVGGASLSEVKELQRPD